MPTWLREFLPILLLLVAVSIVFARLPRIDMGHSARYLSRRRWNWLPLGLTYAFLYMGRYNLTVSKNALGDLMSKSDFGYIFGPSAVILVGTRGWPDETARHCLGQSPQFLSCWGLNNPV